MIKILHYLALFRVKNANFFAEFFGKNIFKNHNIGPSPHVLKNWIRRHQRRTLDCRRAEAG
jgi:hypothetical protein